MLDVRDYLQKIGKYKMVDVFRYDGVGPLRIFVNIVRLIFYQIIGRRFVEAPVNNYRMILDLETPGLSKALFIYGSREILDTKLILREMESDTNFLEVGANIGYYALLEAINTSSGKVIAFEPDPRNISLLRKNITLNNLERRIELYPLAASDENTKQTFYLGDRTNISNFVHTENSVGSVEVECVRLDEFDHINQVDFIRMDIEGYECKVLRGLKKIIENTAKPLKIFIEVHSSKYNDSDLNFVAEVERLFEFGFKTKYIIGSNKELAPFLSRGYKSIGKGVETETIRHLFYDVSEKDTIDFLNKRVIRSMLFERL